MTLNVYQGKSPKNVLILSTIHRAFVIEKEKKKLPDLLQQY